MLAYHYIYWRKILQLTGASVLITGGRRVGCKLALLLAERGMSVALTYHSSREHIEQTVVNIRRLGVAAEAIAADLALPEEAERAVDLTIQAFGRIDVLINMASIFQPMPFKSLKASDFDAMIAANLSGPSYVAIAAAQRMLAQDVSASCPQSKIINFGDWASDRPYRGYLPYLVAKGGLKTLTLALAKELAPRVAVNMIQPGMIEPPLDLSAMDIEHIVSQTPLEIAGQANDVNRLVLFLLEGTDFATGACFRVDGGRFLGQD